MENKKTAAEKLLYAIGNIEDDLVLEGDRAFPATLRLLHSKKRRKQMALTAACFLFCFGLWYTVENAFRMGSSQNSSGAIMEEAIVETVAGDRAEAEETAPETADTTLTEEAAPEMAETTLIPGADGKQEAANYTHYASPLLSLDLLEEQEDLSVERTLTVDAQQRESNRVLVQDSYLLTNHSQQEQTLTLSYSMGSSFRKVELPQLLVNGEENREEQQLRVSNSLTAFCDDGENLSLYSNSWDRFVTALSAANWLDEDREFTDVSILVYEIYDVSAPKTAPEAATVALQFRCDEDTLIWNNNLNGLWQDGEERRYDVFLSEWQRHPQQSKEIWVFGDEVQDLTLQAYTDGSCEIPLDGVSAKVRSYQSSLEEAVTRALGDYVQSQYPEVLEHLDMDSLCTAALQYLRYSPLGEEPQPRYQNLQSWELFSDVLAVERLFKLEQTVTIPAQSSIQVDIVLEKEPSWDMERREYGLEIAAGLGSTLHFESQSLICLPPQGELLLDSSVSSGEQDLSSEQEPYRLQWKAVE